MHYELNKRLMKKMFLAVLLAVISVGANAQFEKGTKYINMSLTGLDLSYQKGKKFHFGLEGQAGYFVKQNWMVGGQLGYEYQGGGPIHIFDLGANFRYYFQKSGVFVGGGLLYQHESAGGKSNFLSFVPEAGYCFYLNRNISIEPAVYCHICMNDFEYGSKFGLKVGFSYYF